MEYLLHEPVFYFGIIAGLLISFLFRFFKQNKEDEKFLPDSREIKAVDEMLRCYENNIPIDVDKIYSAAFPKSEKKVTAAFVAHSIMMWMAEKYVLWEYQTYSQQFKELYNICDLLFGKDSGPYGAYEKIKMYESLINLGPYYYHPDRIKALSYVPAKSVREEYNRSEARREYIKKEFQMLDLVFNASYESSFAFKKK